MKKTLIICRGLPGSGKTTFSKLIGKAICSADDYFMHNGEYCWDKEKIYDAHAWCIKKCERFMKINALKIIIANTNTTTKEMQPYIELANIYGYDIFTIIVENRHKGKNIHDVPEETIEKMKNRFEIVL
ncbi:MAG TPA: AAA family ATPase [archaeon]|nr:AAA family ATPase [archaeon]